MRALALLLVLTLAPLARSQPARPHVYLIIVDGLGAGQLDPESMPRLAALGRAGLHTETHASMPTRTNPSHATLLTGVLPESHGITGNGYWDRAAKAIRGLDRAEQLEVETLFTVAETATPVRHTVAAFSKAKLGRLFGAVPGRQKGPDVLWLPPDGGTAGHVVGIAGDAATMGGFLAAAAEREPDLAAINLSEVDRAAHLKGPAATAAARRSADAAIGRLIDDLHARGRWERSVVLVTSDHGFDDVAPTPERREPVVSLGRRFAAEGIAEVATVGDGGTAHVYATNLAPDATAAGTSAGVLAWAAAVAWREPGVAEVVARLPVDGVPNLADVHAEWGLAHERAGDLLIVARPGFHFIDTADLVSGRFRGNHGSPREARVPLVIGGGALVSPLPVPASPPSSADVGATIAALLGLPPVRRFDGRAVRLGKPLRLSLRGATYSPHWEK
jgi:arylsulfatase A-like enzyme